MARDKFAALDTEFKDAVAGMDEESIRKKVSDIALAQEALMKAKDDDEDLASAKEQFSVAGEIYRQGSKLNRLRIQFCKQVLEDRGKDADGSYESED